MGRLRPEVVDTMLFYHSFKSQRSRDIFMKATSLNKHRPVRKCPTPPDPMTKAISRFVAASNMGGPLARK